MVIHVKFVIVAGRGDRAQFEAYNYDHTVKYFDESRGYFVGVLRVEGPTDEIAYNSAKYQADRYRSGLYASEVQDSMFRNDELADFLDKHCPQAFV